MEPVTGIRAPRRRGHPQKDLGRLPGTFKKFLLSRRVESHSLDKSQQFLLSKTSFLPPRRSTDGQ